MADTSGNSGYEIDYVCDFCRISFYPREEILDHLLDIHGVNAKCKPGSNHVLIYYNCINCEYSTNMYTLIFSHMTRCK